MHVGWNAFTKRSRNGLLFLWTAMALGSLLLAIPAAVLVAREGLEDASGWPYAAASAAVHAAYFFALSRAYGSGDLSLVYPVSRGLSIALVAGLAWPLMGERPTPLGAAGILLVIAGVALVAGQQRASSGAGGAGTGAEDTHGRGSRGGLGWAVITGLLITAYSLIDKRGTAQVAPLPYLVALILGSCLLLAPWVAYHHRALAQEWRINGRTIRLSAVLSVSAYLLVLHAMQQAPVSYVVTAREISIVLSVVIGRMFMGEQPSPRRLGGAVVIVTGVVCLALAH